jgi:UDP-glucose 4-epimerase
VTDPLKYYENNVANTILLLQASLAHDVRYFIFSSSCATYGVPESTPIDETHPLNPINAEPKK